MSPHIDPYNDTQAFKIFTSLHPRKITHLFEPFIYNQGLPDSILAAIDIEGGKLYQFKKIEAYNAFIAKNKLERAPYFLPNKGKWRINPHSAAVIARNLLMLDDRGEYWTLEKKSDDPIWLQDIIDREISFPWYSYGFKNLSTSKPRKLKSENNFGLTTYSSDTYSGLMQAYLGHNLIKMWRMPSKRLLISKILGIRSTQ